MLFPDLLAHVVDGLKEQQRLKRGESSAEITGRRRSWNPLCVERVEIRFIGSPRFQMIETRPAGQQVVGDVENVIGLGVGRIDLEDVDSSVDRLAKSELLDHLGDRAESSAGHGLLLFRQLVSCAWRVRNRPHAGPSRLINSFVQSALAFAELFA